MDLLELAWKFDAATDIGERLDIWDQAGPLAGDRGAELMDRYEHLADAHPDFPWPAETVVRGMGLVPLSGMSWGQAPWTVRACGCAYKDHEGQIAQCDAHAPSSLTDLVQQADAMREQRRFHFARAPRREDCQQETVRPADPPPGMVDTRAVGISVSAVQTEPRFSAIEHKEDGSGRTFVSLRPAPSGPCAKWTGPGGDCTTCGVGAYDHRGAPTPDQRGCRGFRYKWSIVDIGSAARCEFCLLPFRDHAAPAVPHGVITYGGDGPTTVRAGWTLGNVISEWVDVRADAKTATDARIADACERARLFLAGLSDLSLSDSRKASELRHALRTPGVDVLKAATVFLAGVHPAQRGQRELVADLMQVVKPKRERPPAPAPRGMTQKQVDELRSYK